MDFLIQASNPKFAGHHDDGDQNLDEAIESSFPLETESAFLVWHHIPIALSYKYDISVIAVDLIALLSKLLREPAGTHEVEWPSNTFHARWKMIWNGEGLTIESDWKSVVGGLEAQLNASGQLRLSKKEFVSEWKEVLKRTIEGLKSNGYEPHLIVGMEDLAQLIDKIPGVGLLYH
ncbi:MAG: hypothetical protein JWP91_3022 [Fibrobacteres bacterium]|nr:hypothetical protein [Fibrobacterota bacterium]